MKWLRSLPSLLISNIFGLCVSYNLTTSHAWIVINWLLKNWQNLSDSSRDPVKNNIWYLVLCNNHRKLVYPSYLIYIFFTHLISLIQMIINEPRSHKFSKWVCGGDFRFSMCNFISIGNNFRDKKNEEENKESMTPHFLFQSSYIFVLDKTIVNQLSFLLNKYEITRTKIHYFTPSHGILYCNNTICPFLLIWKDCECIHFHRKIINNPIIFDIVSGEMVKSKWK